MTTSGTYASPQCCDRETIGILHSHGVASLRAGVVPSLDVAMVSSHRKSHLPSTEKMIFCEAKLGLGPFYPLAPRTTWARTHLIHPLRTWFGGVTAGVTRASYTSWLYKIKILSPSSSGC